MKRTKKKSDENAARSNAPRTWLPGYGQLHLDVDHAKRPSDSPNDGAAQVAMAELNRLRTRTP